MPIGGPSVNYFEHHIGDYDKNTSHLTACEDGIYHRLIRRYYDKEIPLPADVDQVKRLARARDKLERAAVDTIINEFFKLEADGWHHKTCDEVIASYQAGEPEREAKKKNEDTRLERHRRERAELFAVINQAGQHLPYNASIADVRALATKVRKAAETPPETPPETVGQAVAAATPATAPATPATATQAPTTNPHPPNTTPQEIEDSVPDGTGAAGAAPPADPPAPPPPPPPADPPAPEPDRADPIDAKTAAELTKTELWRAGKSLLREQKMPEAQCGTFVGKLVKDYGDAVVLDAVRGAVVQRPADAASWLVATCKAAKGGPGAKPGQLTGEQQIAASLAKAQRIQAAMAATNGAAKPAVADQGVIDG